MRRAKKRIKLYVVNTLLAIDYENPHNTKMHFPKKKNIERKKHSHIAETPKTHKKTQNAYLWCCFAVLRYTNVQVCS